MKAALIAILFFVALSINYAQRTRHGWPWDESEVDQRPARPAGLADYIMNYKRDCRASGCGEGKCRCPVGKQVGHPCWCEFPKAQPFNECC